MLCLRYRHFPLCLTWSPPPPISIKICWRCRCQLSQRKVSIWRYRLIDILYFIFLLSNVGIRYFFLRYRISNYSLLFHYRFPTLVLPGLPLRCVPVSYYQTMSAAGAILHVTSFLPLMWNFCKPHFGAPVPWRPGAYVPHCPPPRLCLIHNQS